MNIPMGLVVTICMAMGVVFANRLPAGALNTRTPRVLLQIVGSVCLAAGLWNALWHGTRHFTQFWGQMAFGSGVVLCAVGLLLLLAPQRIPQQLETARPFLVLLLAGFAAVYGWTIYFLYFPK